MRRPVIETTVIDGVAYSSAVAADGWPTGPCSTADRALERLHRYESGDEVSEAAPGQFSRAQMTVALSWGQRERLDEEVAMIERARQDGLHSEAWVRASFRLLSDMLRREIPRSVWDAGGARIRRSAGEPSLTRGES